MRWVLSWKLKYYHEFIVIITPSIHNVLLWQRIMVCKREFYQHFDDTCILTFYIQRKNTLCHYMMNQYTPSVSYVCNYMQNTIYMEKKNVSLNKITIFFAFPLINFQNTKGISLYVCVSVRTYQTGRHETTWKKCHCF